MRPRIDPQAVRDRIVDIAEEHFRRVGYAKTAVSDIAAALDMSPANVYRFFASKSEINEAICARIMREGEAVVDAIIANSGPAADILRDAILATHRFNRDRLIGERRLHDMVEAAMAENWASIEAHCDRMRDKLGVIVAKGVATGEFAATDAALAGRAVYMACACLFHPVLIAQNLDRADSETEARALIALLIAGLRRKDATVSPTPRDVLEIA